MKFQIAKSATLPDGEIHIGNMIHVVRFFNLVDLWVTKIKKPMILCVCSMSRSNEECTKHTHTATTCKRWVYSIAKITIVRLSNLAETFLEKFRRCAKDCGHLFLTVLSAC